MLPNLISIIKNIVSDENYRIHPYYYVAINPQYLKTISQKYENDEDFARFVICNEIHNNHNTTHLQYIIVRPDALAYRISEERFFHKRYIRASLKIIKNNPQYSYLFTLTQKLVKSYRKYFSYDIENLDYVFVNRDFVNFYARSRGSSFDDAEIDLFLKLGFWEENSPQEQYVLSKNIFINTEKLVEILRENETHIDEELVLQYIKFKPSLKLLDRIMKQLQTTWGGYDV